MRVLLVFLTLLTGSISFSQEKITSVKLNDIDTDTLVCLKSSDYYISLSKDNLTRTLEKLNVSNIGRLQQEDTLDLKELQMSVFEQIQCNALDTYLVKTIKNGKAQIFDIKGNSNLSEVSLKYMEAPSIGMKYYIFQTINEHRICLFGIAEYQECP